MAKHKITVELVGWAQYQVCVYCHQHKLTPVILGNENYVKLFWADDCKASLWQRLRGWWYWPSFKGHIAVSEEDLPYVRGDKAFLGEDVHVSDLGSGQIATQVKSHHKRKMMRRRRRGSTQHRK